MKLHKQLIDRRAVLAKAAETLKSEFIGLDKVIDDVIESISSWFLFPNLQDRPVIVNLWGMTGVGKSSLVKRLSQLIGFNKKYYRFDIGEKSVSEWIIKKNLTEIYERDNGVPVILAFDEFQHARTMDEEGKEIDQASSRIVWEILDNGKFHSSQMFKGVSEIYDLQLRLRGLLDRGVTVRNGVITHGYEFYVKEFQNDFNFMMTSPKSRPKKGEKMFFLPDNYLENIFWMARELFETQLDVRPFLEKMNGMETILFLKKVMEIGETPKMVDCSRSLVFIIGNLDEVYKMSANMNPDIDADTFYEDSLKINVSHVKRALRLRFRNEQIARLGNTHIIYPSINNKSFQAIIRKELSLVGEKIQKELGIQFTFDESVADAVYKEGVFPTQGVRPIFTTMNQLITSKIGYIAERIIMKKPQPAKIRIRVEENNLVVEIPLKARYTVFMKEPLNCSLDKLRQSTKDELQSIVAVHESGHAVVMMALTGIIPANIYSVTADAGSKGFVFSKEDRKYISRSSIENQTASLLGGYAAEESVFGRQNVTSGSSSDIEEATKFVASMIKDYGLGDIIAQIRPENIRATHALFDRVGDSNEQVMQLLKKGYQLALDTVKRESLLVIRMGAYLSDHSVMPPKMIREYAALYGSEELKRMIAKGNPYSYRTTLQMLNTSIVEAEMLSPKSISEAGMIVLNSGDPSG